MEEWRFDYYKDEMDEERSTILRELTGYLHDDNDSNLNDLIIKRIMRAKEYDVLEMTMYPEAFDFDTFLRNYKIYLKDFRDDVDRIGEMVRGGGGEMQSENYDRIERELENRYQSSLGDLRLMMHDDCDDEIIEKSFDRVLSVIYFERPELEEMKKNIDRDIYLDEFEVFLNGFERDVERIHNYAVKKMKRRRKIDE